MRLSLLLVLAVAMSGCTVTYGPSFDDETTDPSLHVEILRVWATPETSYGYDASPDHEFIYADLRVTNQMKNESVHTVFFQIITRDGGLYEAKDRDGPDEILPGGSVDLTIGFDEIRQNQVAVTLQYKTFFSNPVRWPLPTY